MMNITDATLFNRRKIEYTRLGHVVDEKVETFGLSTHYSIEFSNGFILKYNEHEKKSFDLFDISLLIMIAILVICGIMFMVQWW